MPDRPAQIASTVIRLGMSMRSGISWRRGPPLPCGSNLWKNPAIGAAYEIRTSGVAALPPNSAITVSPPTAVWPIADSRRRLPGQVHVEPRAETDQPDALASADVRIGLDETDDTAGHKAGHLDDADRTVGAVDHQAVALVLAARLVEIGIEEFARPMLDAGDLAAHRRAVHVAGKDVHEHRDARSSHRGRGRVRAAAIAGPTDDTTPSAGLITSRSSTGVTRSGSRKK